MKKIIIATLCLFSLVCGANAQSTKEVIVEGTGQSEREATEDAFRNAIESSIGLYVDSETMVKNHEVISDKILTISKGYIDKYQLLSVSNHNHLKMVKIKAVVKIQDVKSALKGLNISMVDVKDSANIYAKLSTKLKRSKDAELILKKELAKFFEMDKLLDLLDIELIDYKIHENELQQDNTVPYEISFNISINITTVRLRFLNHGSTI